MSVSSEVKAADGGLSSRKLWYAIGTSIGVFAAGVVSAFWPAFRPGLETVVGGLIGVLTVYLGGNVTSKWVLGKTLAKKTTEVFEKAQETVDEANKPPVEPQPEEE